MEAKLVSELVKSLIKGHGLMDPAAWAPPNPFLLDPLFEDLWLNKILELKKIAGEQNISFKKMAESLMGPACVRKELRWAIWGMKLRRKPSKEIEEILAFYSNILNSKAEKDIFNLHSNYWHDKKEIERLAKDTNWEKSNEETKKIVGKISANCPPVVWGLHTDFFYHRAYELFGLYKNLHLYNKTFGHYPLTTRKLWIIIGIPK